MVTKRMGSLRYKEHVIMVTSNRLLSSLTNQKVILTPRERQEMAADEARLS